jgi:tRNA dimethylallyltransferase
VGHCALPFERRVKPRTVLLAGPTASGKSALALSLAERLGGVVINADSMQVYRDLRILTARPAPEDEARVPHRLYGHVDAAENYSTGRWCLEVGGAIAAAEEAGQVPILVGGTGLYFKTLTRGLAAVPPISPQVRSAVRGRLEREGVEPLYADLKQCDPETARRLMPGDRARITRALEVVESTGRSLSDWHREAMTPVLDPADAVKVFLALDRGELYRRIDARFERMLVSGALDEVAALAHRSLAPSLPAMKALGVPWLIQHLRGESTLAEAAEAGKRDSRRYSKRQETWFRNQLPDWTWVAPDIAEDEIVRALAR